MFSQNDDVLHFGYHMHINAAVVVLRVEVRHWPSLMVVSTIAFDEIALSTLSIPMPAPDASKAPRPGAFRPVLEQEKSALNTQPRGGTLHRYFCLHVVSRSVGESLACWPLMLTFSTECGIPCSGSDQDSCKQLQPGSRKRMRFKYKYDEFV